MRIKHYAITMALALSVLTAARAQTPPPLPTPKEFFGFNIGDNYMRHQQPRFLHQAGPPGSILAGPPMRGKVFFSGIYLHLYGHGT